RHKNIRAPAGLTRNRENNAVSLTYKDVADILKIIDASQLDEIVIEMDGMKLHVRRSAGGGATSLAPAPATTPISPVTPAAMPANPAPKANSAASVQPLAGHAVR